MEIPQRLIDLLVSTPSVAVLTGAGVSAESGISTFRDAQTGLWSKYRPEDLATPEAFKRNPKLVWEWYAWRRGKVAEVKPNAGHYALAQVEERIHDFTLITQNVDGLHGLAGSQNIVELHGSIQRVKCFDCGKACSGWDENGETPPRCPNCGGWLRPDVVWFGEALSAQALEQAFEAAIRSRLFFSIGTSGLVQPAASLPYAAIEAGAVIVEINPEDTPISRDVDFHLSGSSGVILPELVRRAGWA
jgi:NAD-dependent deacetylase